MVDVRLTSSHETHVKSNEMNLNMLQNKFDLNILFIITYDIIAK